MDSVNARGPRGLGEIFSSLEVEEIARGRILCGAASLTNF
jgi:hypothetical protein